MHCGCAHYIFQEMTINYFAFFGFPMFHVVVHKNKEKVVLVKLSEHRLPNLNILWQALIIATLTNYVCMQNIYQPLSLFSPDNQNV